ncbi:transporter substrate-binding domain-containing protein [Aquabacterium sp.]|uniref:transporter substrate-binding domain-containing protein n=1 Tax=Aquabacterium sp. TaxID=1872578 RepID=UPI002B9A4C4B|nr:transporter substrate-binding domain-containing protein [Aquabacterium sp.]HSW03146.1 transporter substrate-binding domain-containing protein [Aquabacterium sp.]
MSRPAAALRRCAGCWAGLWALLLLQGLLGFGGPAWAADAVEPSYRFRVPPGKTVVLPGRDLLDAAERDFIAQLPELRVGLNLPDNRPYEVISADGEISGIQIEILTHIAQALGLKLKPVVLSSFPQALAALRDREVDVMASVGYEPSREAYMSFTLGTAPNPGAIIGRAADPRFTNEPSLNGHRVAIEKGYVTQYYARRLYPEVLIADQPDTAHALRAVAIGEEDYYFGSLLMAMDRIQRDAVTGLEVKKSLVYATGQMHFGVRSDWPLLARALSKGIAALRSGPMPQLDAALQALGSQRQELPQVLKLARGEQRQLAGRSVLRLGAVRGLTLLNEALPSGGHAGIAADYAAQVAARLGVAIDVVPFDNVGAMLDALRGGTIHIVPFLTRTEARALEFVFSQPYLEMPYMIVARSDAPLYWGLDSLRGKRLALAPQHPLRDLLAERYREIQVIDALNGDDAMDRVARGEADAAVEVKLFANMRINGDSGGRLRGVGPVEQLPAQFRFATSREAAALMPLIDRALADIPLDERDRLFRRWVAIDFAPAFPWRRYLPLLATAGGALLLLVSASVWWMRRLAREVQERTAAEERLRDVTDGLPGLVFQYINAPDGRLEERFISAPVESFLGPGLQRGSSLVDAVARRMLPDEARKLLAARSASLATGQPFKETLRYSDPRGGERWLHCEAIPRALPDGRMAWTGYVVDVSTERALQSQLLGAMQAQNLFVASASHELRAPLQAVTLALQGLGDSRLDAAQRRFWRVASDSSSSLVQLIDDVLDLARLEARRLVLQPAPVDLQALLRQLVENHRLAADARGLQMHLHWDDQIPRYLMIDSLRMRQLLVNLVSNAVKYTQQGSVTVVAQRQLEPGQAPDGDSLLLRVQDTGIGIPAERQHALFEPFETLHHPTYAPAEGSTGLGLAICKRLVDAMGGRITLHSVPGQGTEVSVVLPMPAEAEADAPPARVAAAPGPGAVLLVDDDEVSRVLMANMLRIDGQQVLEAGTVAAALQRWQAGGVALLISDRHLPDGDGLDLLRRVADEARAAGDAVRLVLCSGSEPAATDSLGDVAAVLRKPVTAAALRQQLVGLVPPG